MPDWTYRTIFRPLLFRLPTRLGRDTALGLMGCLARLAGGRQLIELLGHMRPALALRTKLGDVELDSPVGLGMGIDPQLTGLHALCRFGFGFVELGPITVQPIAEARSEREDRLEQIMLVPSNCNLGLARVVTRLSNLPRPRPALIARLSVEQSPEELALCASRLVPHVEHFALAIPTEEHNAQSESFWRLQLAATADCVPRQRLLIYVPVDTSEAAVVAWSCVAQSFGVGGAIVGRAESADNVAVLGGAKLPAALRLIAQLRATWGATATIIAAVAIHAPVDAERCVDAGADLVQLDSGLVFTGPGLAKRCNELLLERRLVTAIETAPSAIADTDLLAPARFQWLWTMLLGVSMVIGGLMALVIAVTRVVMPYDEVMAGLSREQIEAINPRLLPFMTHDRATLAGAMLAVGVLFVALSWSGVRHGLHWAHRAIVAPAFVGFLSFFSFLGFGYFDPLHAFATSILFQFMLLAIVAGASPQKPRGVVDRLNDRAWLRAQWGQLIFVLHGLAVLAAGLTISYFGMTTVFVESDLQYLGMCSQELKVVPRLVPLVAHDRGTFGGMLVVAGLTTLLAALWGFRRGDSWLWWALQWSGVLGYVTTLVVHHAVGYTDPLHLTPAYLGLLAVWLGGWLSAEYLCARGSMTTTPVLVEAPSGPADSSHAKS